MKDFKIRSSSSGKIMGAPKLKKDKEAGLLSQTAKTYCEIWLKQELYKRHKKFTSKYTDKGLIVEDNSIDFVGDQLNLGMLIKNEKYFENDFICGTPDIILPKLIIDVKNSWDFSTFPLFDKDIPNMDYYWQAQSYLELTDTDHYKLIYVLSDTPIHLIEKEAYWWCKDNGYDELDADILDEYIARMTYKDIDDSLKIKVFSFDRNVCDIALIKLQVVKCRSYIETLKKLI